MITEEVKEAAMEGEKLELTTVEVAFDNLLKTNDEIISAWAVCKSVLFQNAGRNRKDNTFCETVKKFTQLPGERGEDGNKK